MRLGNATLTTMLAASALLIAASCASRPSDVDTPGAEAADEDQAETIAFAVENDLIPRRSVVVTFHANAAQERLLGSVEPNETQTFTLMNRHAVPPYYLVAEPAGGPDIVSRRIDASTVDTIKWSLGTNRVEIGG